MTLPKRAVIIIASVGVLLSTAAGIALAQTDEQLADYSRPGPYMGLFFVWGKESFNVSGIEHKIANDLESARRSSGECNPSINKPCQTSVLVDRKDTPGFAFRTGYRFTSLLAAELDYQYLNQFEIERRSLYIIDPAFRGDPTAINNANQRVKADIRVHSIMVNGKLYPMQGVIQPYLLAGLGTVIGDSDNRISDRGSDVEALFGGRIGGGIDYYFTRNVAFNFDVSYTVTTKTFKPGGYIDDISLTHVPISAGLIYRFGLPAAQQEPPPPPPPPVAAAPVPMKKKIILRGVNFDFDKSNIRADARPVLDEAVSTLKDAGEIRVSVEGHTDSRGTDPYNEGLSIRRANSVADYLEKGGIDGSRMEVKGFGESRPVASNDTGDGRAQNRRVELSVIP